MRLLSESKLMRFRQCSKPLWLKVRWTEIGEGSADA